VAVKLIVQIFSQCSNFSRLILSLFHLDLNLIRRNWHSFDEYKRWGSVRVNPSVSVCKSCSAISWYTDS